MRNCLFREGIRLVLDDEVELLLGAKDLYPQESVEYQPLFTYAMVLIAPLDHPLVGRATVSRKKPPSGPPSFPQAGFYTRMLEEASIEGFGVERNTVIEISGWEGVKRYVERGFGISMIPSICVSKADRLSVVSLPDSFPRLSFGVFTRRNHVLDPHVRRFLRLMTLDFPLSAPQAAHAC